MFPNVEPHRKARCCDRKTWRVRGPLGGGYAALGRRCYAQFPRARGFGAEREAQAFTGRFSRLVSANGRNRRARTVEVEFDEKTGSLHQLGVCARERISEGVAPGASPAPKGHAVVRAPDNLNSERSAQVPTGVSGREWIRWCAAAKKHLCHRVIPYGA